MLFSPSTVQIIDWKNPHRLRVAAGVALHVLLDETLQQLHQLLGVVRAVHNGGARLLVEVCLCPQLTTIELDDVCR